MDSNGKNSYTVHKRHYDECTYTVVVNLNNNRKVYRKSAKNQTKKCYDECTYTVVVNFDGNNNRKVYRTPEKNPTKQYCDEDKYIVVVNLNNNRKVYKKSETIKKLTIKKSQRNIISRRKKFPTRKKQIDLKKKCLEISNDEFCIDTIVTIDGEKMDKRRKHYEQQKRTFDQEREKYSTTLRFGQKGEQIFDESQLKIFPSFQQSF